MSTLGDATDVNPVIKFLPHTLHVCGRNLITGLTSATSPRVDISINMEIVVTYLDTRRITSDLKFP